MNKSFHLKVIASNRIFYSGECESLIFPVTDGLMGVMANHANMIIAISMGSIQIKQTNGVWLEGFVGQGLVEFINNRAVLLVETAERPEEIDIRRAEEAKQRAEERLRQQMSRQEYYHSKAALARAMSRLKAAGRFRSDKI